MSGIVAVFQRRGAPLGPELIPDLLGRLGDRGGDATGALIRGPCGLGVARHGWEAAPALSGPSLEIERDGVALVADASLYYRAELCEVLARHGVVARGDSPSELILAAYLALGEGCLACLEGDYAFALWDGRRDRLFCARDFVGSRPLYYADLGRAVVIGSTIDAVIAYPGCPKRINYRFIAESIAGSLGAVDESCFSAVATLPPGHSLLVGPGSTVRRRFWALPRPTPFRAAPFEEGARELRTLLERAVSERMDPAQPTSVWLSGGWDSTAVYAAGQSARCDRTAGSIRPVSISYPEGDPGREDELIRSVVAHWAGEPPNWIDIDEVPALDPEFDDPAAAGGDCFVHPYRTWNHALARGSRECGSRVALTGNGGDALFQISPMYLSDLFFRGEWRAFRREWRAKRFRSRSRFLRWVIRPALPPRWRIGFVPGGGRQRMNPLHRPVPSWITAAGLRPMPMAPDVEPEWWRGCDRSAVALQVVQPFIDPFVPRVTASVGETALRAGVELRHPLLDRRVVEFALQRPWWELASGLETKRLLRAAMQGLLPASVLEPRPFRTGTCGEAFARKARPFVAEWVRAASTGSRLAERGLLDLDELRQAADAYARGGAGHWWPALVWTVHAERWLAATAPGRGDPRRVRAGEVRADQRPRFVSAASPSARTAGSGTH